MSTSLPELTAATRANPRGGAQQAPRLPPSPNNANARARRLQPPAQGTGKTQRVRGCSHSGRHGRRGRAAASGPRCSICSSAWPGLAWPGLAGLPGPGLAGPGPSWPGLALAWPGPGLAWPGPGPGPGPAWPNPNQVLHLLQQQNARSRRHSRAWMPWSSGLRR